MWRTFLVALIMLFPLLVCASPSWQKRYSVDFRLGDSDSRLDARHAALEDIRHLAAAEAESYVHTRTEYADDEIQESIEVVSASMVLLENIQESLTLNDSGQPVLQLSADATLDDRLLERRINALIDREARYERAERLEVENQRLKERVASSPTYLSTSVTLYDQLSSYSSQEYNDTPATKDHLEVVQFETAVRDSELSEFIDNQVLPRIADKGVSLTPGAMREVNGHWQLSFNLDWDLPFDALEQRLESHVSLVPANPYAWPGEGNNRGRKIDLRQQRRERPASLPMLDLLTRWRGDVTVLMVNKNGDVRTVHREPFWYVSRHRGLACQGDDASAPSAARGALYLCLLEGMDRNSAHGMQAGVPASITLTDAEREALSHLQAEIEWSGEGG